jgi:hypothetical protein
MTRQLENEGFGTPFGEWIRKNCKDSKCNQDGTEALTVSNIDYVLYDYKMNAMMLLEEKHGIQTEIPYGQRCIYRKLDEIIRLYALRQNKDIPEPYQFKFWGTYVLNMDGGLPHDGMLLNGQPITVQQLIDHLNFHQQAVKPLF